MKPQRLCKTIICCRGAGLSGWAMDLMPIVKWKGYFLGVLMTTFGNYAYLRAEKLGHWMIFLPISAS